MSRKSQHLTYIYLILKNKPQTLLFWNPKGIFKKKNVPVILNTLISRCYLTFPHTISFYYFLIHKWYYRHSFFCNVFAFPSYFVSYEDENVISLFSVFFYVCIMLNKFLYISILRKKKTYYTIRKRKTSGDTLAHILFNIMQIWNNGVYGERYRVYFFFVVFFLWILYYWFYSK